jgi:DNA-binding LacI/PurR family transcriptional regulator
MARTAGTILLEWLDTDRPAGGPVIFPPELVVRTSA